MDIHTLEQELSAVSPGFTAYLWSNENFMSRDTLRGVFAAYSHYLRESPPPAHAWHSIGSLVNLLSESHDQELQEALCTCFLENLASKNHPLEGELREPALGYWRYWAVVTDRPNRAIPGSA